MFLPSASIFKQHKWFLNTTAEGIQWTTLPLAVILSFSLSINQVQIMVNINKQKKYIEKRLQEISRTYGNCFARAHVEGELIIVMIFYMMNNSVSLAGVIEFCEYGVSIRSKTLLIDKFSSAQMFYEVVGMDFTTYLDFLL